MNTFGPWQVDPINAHAPDRNRYVVSSTGIVCRLNGYASDTVANAQLIAAAPDLLAALQRWELYATDNDYSEDTAAPGYCSFLAATRAAIAKALG